MEEMRCTIASNRVQATEGAGILMCLVVFLINVRLVLENFFSFLLGIPFPIPSHSLFTGT